MSRQIFDRAPLCMGSSPRYFGLAGSVTSTNAVPLVRPTRANSRLVTLSVQPQISLSNTPRFPPSALTGRKDTRSASRHSNALPFPPSHLASPHVTAARPAALLSATEPLGRH